MIVIKNLTFGYSKKKLLYDDLTLSLPVGSIYGLLGKNGAGKSTLLKNLMGLLFPHRGLISVNDFNPKKRLPSFLQTIYFIPEEVYVPTLSIAAYCNLFGPFYPNFNKDQLALYLKQLDIKDHGKLNTFSFGQQKKFIIAFALACNTQVLILDEPTNGLDIPSKIQFRKLLASIMNQQRLILISTHQVRDLENLIDTVIIVDNGKLLLNASIEKITTKLCFKILKEQPADLTLLHVEESLKGVAVVYENTEGEMSRVNLEQLFNAVTENSARIEDLFSNN